MDLDPGRVILHLYLADRLCSELIRLSVYRDCVLIFGRCYWLPSGCSPVCFSLVLIVGNSIGIDLKGHRPALCIPFWGFHLYQDVGPGSQRLIGFNVAHRLLLYLTVYNHLPDGGIGFEYARLVSFPVLLDDPLAFVI